METTKEKRATFTPGPWYLYLAHKDVNRHISCKDGNTIAKEVHHANARLIAAAPAMYEMCKLFEECMENIDNLEDHDASYELAKVREVLAKVEGGEG
jgi:hypothetical protein